MLLKDPQATFDCTEAYIRLDWITDSWEELGQSKCVRNKIKYQMNTKLDCSSSALRGQNWSGPPLRNNSAKLSVTMHFRSQPLILLLLFHNSYNK